MTKHKLVFFGTEDFSSPSLLKLIAGGWDVQAVVTKPDSRSGRGLQIQPSKVKQFASSADIKIYQPEKLLDITPELEKIKPDFGVLVAYGKIIPHAILDLFPGGIVNVHPSLLPKYRGASPIESVILNGDKQTGVSLMRLNAGMDEGPIYAQKRVDVPSDTDGSSFSAYLAEVGAKLLIEKLDSIIQGWLTPRPQTEADASYSKLLKKTDGAMDFNKPAEQLEREVRAYIIWPKSSATIHGQKVVVTKARVAKDEKDGELVLKCQPGWLEVLELKAPSGRTMSGADFLRGYKK